MRRYLGDGGAWEPAHVLALFNRETKVWPNQGKVSKERTVETFYTCTNPRVTFEDDTIPVIK